MQRVTSLPLKMPTVWASGAASPYIRAVPDASQIPTAIGAASFTDGFVPANFTAVAAGGIPPFGQDMNGVLNRITAWNRWMQAGGPIRYDAVFQGQIGGYPAEARVGSNTIDYLIWQSTADNNLTNPDAGGAGWSVPQFPDPGTAALYVRAAVNTAQGSGAAIGFVGNTISNPDGFTVAAPNKWLRVVNGNFAVINNAYTAEIFTLTDAGDVLGIRNLTAGGIITAGSITSLNDATVTKKLTVGSLEVLGATTIDGNGTITGNATISGNATVAGTLKVTGLANFGSVEASGHLYGGTEFKPVAANYALWRFYEFATQETPPKYYTVQEYSPGWADLWSITDGSRSWQNAIAWDPVSGAATAWRVVMQLSGTGLLRVFGDATVDGVFQAPVGGVLSGSLPNPGFAAGAVAGATPHGYFASGAGAGNWPVPKDVYVIRGKIWGGGAGGGGAHPDGAGGGGGAGAYSEGVLNVTPGQVIHYDIGYGGAGGYIFYDAGGIEVANGGDGGASSFGALTAPGGHGGQTGSGFGGVGGNGGSPGLGASIVIGGGPGGDAATANGGIQGGHQGSTFCFAGRPDLRQEGDGHAAVFYGCGGQGALAFNADRGGGNGYSGLLIVEW